MTDLTSDMVLVYKYIYTHTHAHIHIHTLSLDLGIHLRYGDNMYVRRVLIRNLNEPLDGVLQTEVSPFARITSPFR
jgi:hypothetical protein